MQLFVYLLVFPIVWLLSILPFRILYVISDGLFLVVYHIVKYRKKVVYKNLSLAFPEKTEKEIKVIEKKFYHHLIDVFIEMIKFFTISKKELDKRYAYTNIDIFKNLYKEKKSVIILTSHHANWEWIVGIQPKVKFNRYGVYQKIENKYINNALKKSRSRFGGTLILTRETFPFIARNYKNKTLSIYGLASDQSPAVRKSTYWNYFFNKYVPIHTGAEAIVKKYDLNVVYASTKKIKRGYYETTFTKIDTNSLKNEKFAITNTYIKMLENQIRQQPEYYLWSHRRFKHMK